MSNQSPNPTAGGEYYRDEKGVLHQGPKAPSPTPAPAPDKFKGSTNSSTPSE